MTFCLQRPKTLANISACFAGKWFTIVLKLIRMMPCGDELSINRTSSASSGPVGLNVDSPEIGIICGKRGRGYSIVKSISTITTDLEYIVEISNALMLCLCISSMQARKATMCLKQTTKLCIKKFAILSDNDIRFVVHATPHATQVSDVKVG